VVANFDSKAVDNPVLTLEKSGLKAGQFAGQELLQAAKVADLTVGEGGSIKSATPITRLEPRTVYIIKLTGK